MVFGPGARRLKPHATRSAFNPETGVLFHRVEHAGSLVEFLSTIDGRPLLERGAVYVDGRRVRAEVTLAPNQLLRIHTKPKSYAVPEAPLRERVVFEHEDFVILDKPSGLPTHATLDNATQNAASLLQTELRQPLFVTHRLDIPTEGLLILARTTDAQRLINGEFARGRVIKQYSARADVAIVAGSYQHHLDPAARVPRPVSTEPREGWWCCRLIVKDFERDRGSFVHQVQPLTGKTHQIRAQFAALGAPLLGDDLYGGRAPARFGLACVGLRFRLRGTDHTIVRRLT